RKVKAEKLLCRVRRVVSTTKRLIFTTFYRKSLTNYGLIFGGKTTAIKTSNYGWDIFSCVFTCKKAIIWLQSYFGVNVTMVGAAGIAMNNLSSLIFRDIRTYKKRRELDEAS
ncbi:MAG: hypothetical protein KAS23_09445, partial [Anaerohalosphaera sp.]|nr:hypothetical protein [Anaerohalosphaera sp.]